MIHFSTKKIGAAVAVLFCVTTIFAQDAKKAVDHETSEKAFKVMEAAYDTLAYKGDYSATVTLVIDKPGKPQENMQFKIFERINKDLMTMVQLFPEADKGTGYMNGFAVVKAYQNFNKSLEVVATVMIFAGALCGILLGLFTGNKLGYIVALAVSVIGGIIIFTNTADIGINFAKNFLGIGFYFIIIGWIVAAVGIILSAIRK